MTSIEQHKHERGPLVSVLQDINAASGYLPPRRAAVREPADGGAARDGLPRGHVLQGIQPDAAGQAYRPRVHGHGLPRAGASAGILEAFEDRLEIKPGQTTADLKFTLETVNCLGTCAMAPVDHRSTRSIMAA